MSQRNYYLKVRMNADDYKSTKERASEAGLNMSEFVRTVLDANEQASTVNTILQRIEENLPSNSNNLLEKSEHDPLLVEVLFLVREIVAERNAQILARIAQRLDVMYPWRDKL